jgi:signal transduction histidine kinase
VVSRMKIGQKLTLAFIGVALLIGVAGYISFNTSQKALQESIGESSVSLAVGTLSNIDRTIYNRIEEFQIYSGNLEVQKAVKESNEEFEKLGDIQYFIEQKDKEWTALPAETITDFMWELANNEPAKELKRRLKFYEEKYGYRVFGEVFVTNKYGTNIAQTGKTTDYNQADELWWQIAKKDGFYVADVRYDASSDVYSTDLGIRIDDENGNFAGVIKAVLNIEGVIDIMKKAKETSPYETTELKLFDIKGKLIFDTEGSRKSFKDILDERIYGHITEKMGHILKAGEPGEGGELFAYAYSKGYREYRPLGWILAVEYETKEIFAPVAELKNIMLIAPVTLTVVAVLIGMFVSRTISSPVRKLRDAVVEVSKGKFDATIEIKSEDEIGELANSFNRMTWHLKKMVDNLNGEVTERKKAEESLEKLNKDLELTVKKLSWSNRELQEFAYVAAHDLKAPLRAIGTLAEWLSTDYSDKFDEEGKEKVELLVGRAERIDKLIDSILQYSEIGDIGQEKQVVDLNLLLSEVIHKIGPPDNIEITIENELPSIMCNKKRIVQVFHNLLSNAVKYMDKPKGQIRIGCSEDDDFWTFSVSDNGPGIKQKYFEKIFKIFQTLATRDEVEAVGIGLPMTRKIVELYGGRIWVQSEPGQGSTFYFTLPMQEMRVKS